MFLRITFFLLIFILCQGELLAQSQRDFTAELENLKTTKDTVQLNQKIEKLKAGSEEDLGLLILYVFEKGLDYRPLIDLAANRFPRGRFAFDKAMERFTKEQNLKTKIRSIDSLKKLFKDQNYDQAYGIIAVDYTRAGNIDAAVSYLKKTSKSYQQMVWSQLASNSNPNSLKQLLPLLNHAIAEKDLSKSEQVNLLKVKRGALEKTNNYRGAALVALKILDLNPKSSQYDRDHYSFLLSKSGQYREALPGMEQAVIREIDNEEYKNEYKKAYQKTYPSRNVTQHLDSIQKALEKKYEIKYKSSEAKLIKEKAPEFELLDAEGKKVFNDNFKGKILVIDFWATWCGPCKASLPGMQSLVNKYKEDQNIKFLFVHTAEPPGSTLEYVKKSSLDYFNSHHFSLPLYIDLKTQKDRENRMAKSFKVGGIPHKVIVDSSGYIRSNTIGFDGSNINLVAEMSSLIEAVKKSQ